MADSSAIICPMGTANTPSIQDSATALAANPARGAFMIQNLGTNALFLKFGSGATTSEFHIVLKGGSVNDDGTGASFAMSTGIVFTDIVSVAGTLPRYVSTELTK